MKLIVLNPEKTLLEAEVSIVELPGVLGRFAVLRGHDRLVSILTEGVVRYALMEESTDDERHELPVSGGFVEVKDNVITVCAD